VVAQEDDSVRPISTDYFLPLRARSLGPLEKTRAFGMTSVWSDFHFSARLRREARYRECLLFVLTDLAEALVGAGSCPNLFRPSQRS
jgi:hypothetical protein